MKHFIWCRAWPWYRATFQFERFDALDGADLIRALNLLVSEWVSANPGKVEEARVAKRERDDMRRNGRMTPPDGPWRTRPRPPLDLQKPATFSEVAVLAGWIDVPRGVVLGRTPDAAIRPSSRVYVHWSNDPECAEAVAAALLLRKSLVLPGLGFGSAVARIRYGVLKSAQLDKVKRVLVTRAFDDFSEGTDRSTEWARPLAEEARRIEEHLRDEADANESEPAEDGDGRDRRGSKPRATKLGVGEQRALESYQCVVTRHPELIEANERNYDRVYVRLRELVELGECEQYADLSALTARDTWTRYVRKGLNMNAPSAAQSDHRDDHGSSVVDQNLL